MTGWHEAFTLMPKSSRVVVNAAGPNAIELRIPCLRFIQQSSALDGYRWGIVKRQMVQVRELEQLTAPSPNPERLITD